MTENLSREDLIEAVKKAAVIVGNDLSRSDFERTTGISQHHIYKLFPEGGWSEIKK